MAGDPAAVLQFTYAGSSNQPFVVEQSVDLKTWALVGSGTDSAAPNAVFVKAGGAAGYFRAIETNLPAARCLGLACDTTNAYVSPGTVYDAAGVAIEIAGGPAALLPAPTNFVVINLFDRRPYCLRRAIDSGSILVGTVVWSNGAPVCQGRPDIRPPKTGVAKAKLAFARTGERLTVDLFGDSLTAGGGTGVLWWSLLWTFRSPTNGFFEPTAGNAFIRNLATPGITAEYVLSAVQPVLAEGARPDLAVVAIGINNGDGMRGGTNPAPYFGPALEDTVRKLRAAGSEVLLVTENAKEGRPDYGAYVGESMAELAARHGCSVADTWAYVDRVNQLGTNTFFDSVHQTQPGWNEWARAVAGCLTADIQESAVATPGVGGQQILGSLNPSENSRLFDAAPLLTPVGFDGRYVETNAFDAQILPFLYGLEPGRTTEIVTPGQSVFFDPTNWVACALVCDRGSGSDNFTGELDVLDEAGAVLLAKPVAWVDSNFGGPTLVALTGYITISDTEALADSAGVLSRRIRFTTTSGTARVIGLMAFTRGGG
jgi:lysophospholipase L1-like esterase